MAVRVRFFSNISCSRQTLKKQSKHSAKFCCQRLATAHLDRTNAYQRAERRQGRRVFLDLNKHDTVSPSRVLFNS